MSRPSGIRLRLVMFWRRQRRAFIELVARPPVEDGALSLHVPVDTSHPSQLCRCHDGGPPPHQVAAHMDHLPDCEWAAAMCRECDGDGCCRNCGGDGVDPWHYARTGSAT